MTDDEAIRLGQEAIYHATYRDAYSGGMNQVYIVKPDGKYIFINYYLYSHF